MRRKLIISCLILGFALIAFVVPLPPSSPNANELVRASLTDPDSAQFYDVVTYPKTKGACGLVNSKNRLGGYGGKKPFIVTSLGVVEFFPDAPPSYLSTSDQLAILKDQLAWVELAKVNCPGSPLIQKVLQ